MLARVKWPDSRHLFLLRPLSKLKTKVEEFAANSSRCCTTDELASSSLARGGSRRANKREGQRVLSKATSKAQSVLFYAIQTRERSASERAISCPVWPLIARNANAKFTRKPKPRQQQTFSSLAPWAATLPRRQSQSESEQKPSRSFSCPHFLLFSPNSISLRKFVRLPAEVSPTSRKTNETGRGRHKSARRVALCNLLARGLLARPVWAAEAQLLEGQENETHLKPSVASAGLPDSGVGSLVLRSRDSTRAALNWKKLRSVAGGQMVRSGQLIGFAFSSMAGAS